MTLEQQCCSLQQAKRLKELGVKQESEFYYTGTYGLKHVSAPASWGMEEIIGEYVNEHIGHPAYEIFSAYTVAELGEMLPDYCYSKKDSLTKKGYAALIVERHVALPAGILSTKTITGETEAQARAELLIYLIETGVVKP